MAEPRGEVGWGDAVRAAAELGLSSASDLELLLDLLDLTAQAPAEDPAAASTGPAPAQPTGATTREWSTPGILPVHDEVEHDTVVEVLDPLPVDFAPSRAEPLETASARSTVAYEPPVSAVLLRAALVRLVRRTRRSEQVDLDAAVRMIAEQRPLADLRVLFEPTTHRGATIIADVGRAMLPYHADVERFVSETAQAVGAPNIRVHRVNDASSLDAARLVEPGRPVLLLSALGAVLPPGEPAVTRWRWVRFAEDAEEVRADVVALVPHRLRAWPEAIARAFRLVAWDDLDLVGRGRD
jgi:hypothetical protein